MKSSMLKPRPPVCLSLIFSDNGRSETSVVPSGLQSPPAANDERWQLAVAVSALGFFGAVMILILWEWKGRLATVIGRAGFISKFPPPTSETGTPVT